MNRELNREIAENGNEMSKVYYRQLKENETMQDQNQPQAEEKEVLLEVRNLSQYFKLGHFDLKAVNNVSFNIMKGEVFGLVGESGCGKTTTGRSIIKLYNITGGDVYFKGVRISAGLLEYKNELKAARKAYEANQISAEEYQAIADKNNALIKQAKFDNKNYNKEFVQERCQAIIEEYNKKLSQYQPGTDEFKILIKERDNKLRIAKRDRLVNQIQMIFQDPIASLDPRMTVREIIAEGLKIKGVRNNDEIDEQVYNVLEKVGLVREHANRYPHEFSGGQRQRIGVARSIIMRPEMIIADEPVSALDVSIQAQVINLLNDLRKELGLTILFIAHDLSVVKYFSDRIGVMYFGNLVELATSDELFAHPLHPYTRSLLSAIPLPDPIYEKQRKRIVYNPLADHNYTTEAPTLREVAPGHFVMCDTKELEHYKNVIAGTEKPYAMSNYEGQKVESE